MKKGIYIISAAAFFLITTQVSAERGHSKENFHEKNKINKVQERIVPEIITPTVIVSETPTITPEITKYLKHDGKNEIKEFKKDIRAFIKKELKPTKREELECDREDDYKNHGKYVSCVAHQHRGGKEVSEAARSDIGKEHNGKPTGTVTPLPVISPVTSAAHSIHLGYNPFRSFATMLDRFLSLFKHFL